MTSTTAPSSAWWSPARRAARAARLGRRRAAPARQASPRGPARAGSTRSRAPCDSRSSASSAMPQTAVIPRAPRINSSTRSPRSWSRTAAECWRAGATRVGAAPLRPRAGGDPRLIELVELRTSARGRRHRRVAGERRLQPGAGAARPDARRSPGRGLLSLSDVTGYRAMLMLGLSDRLRGCGAPPLDASDRQQGTALARTLAVYLDRTSNIEAAAQELGIHRHTMRARLRRISELTGRSLSESADLLELWLACEFRALG